MRRGDLEYFLTTHRATLQHIKLANITFIKYPSGDLAGGMLGLLRRLRSMRRGLNLNSVQYTLLRLSSRSGGTYYEDSTGQLSESAVNVLDSVAKKLKVYFNAGGGWDFGEFVMRPP